MADTKIQLANEVLTKTVTSTVNANGGLPLHLDNNYEVISLQSTSGYRMIPTLFGTVWYALVYPVAPNMNQAIVNTEVTTIVYYRRISFN